MIPTDASWINAIPPEMAACLTAGAVAVRRAWVGADEDVSEDPTELGYAPAPPRRRSAAEGSDGPSPDRRAPRT